MTADLPIFFVSHYAILALFLFFAYLWGGVIFDRAFGEQDAARLFINTSTGFGVLILLMFFAGLFSMLYPAVIGVLLLCAPGYYLLRKDFHIFSPLPQGHRMTSRVVICFVLFLLLLPILLPPLCPPTMWDSISYHLPYAKLYADTNSLAVNKYLRFPLYAHNIDLLYALSLLFYDDILAHLFHAATALLTTLGIYHLGKETHSRAVGILAAAFFISSQAVLNWMKTAYIDLGLTLFVFLTFFCLSRWSTNKDQRWLMAGGGAAGLALGCKYGAAVFVSIFAFWVIIETRSFRSFLKFMAPALIVGCPWYVRNVFISGDPISPFGGGTFGYWVWDKTDLAGVGEDILKMHGTARTVTSFLRLPTNLFFHPELFMSDRLSPGILALFPSFLLMRWLPPFYRKVALLVLANLTLWFASSQIVRYLLPALPMIMLLCAVTFVEIYNFIARKVLANASDFVKAAAQNVLPILLAVSLIAEADYRILKYVSEDPIPTTQTSRNQYISVRVPAFDLLQLVNRWPAFSIYQLGFENTFYFAKAKMVGDWFGPARYSIVTSLLNDPKRLHDYFVENNHRFFLFNRNRGFNFNFDATADTFFLKVAENGDAILFLVK